MATKKNKPIRTKSKAVRKIISEALDILENVGIPFAGKRPRGLESMAMAFLSVAGVTNNWKNAQGQYENRNIKTRDIIKFQNENFEEDISSGSYDDVRRKHLKLLLLADLVLNNANNPTAAPNDPTRGYTLDNEFKNLITYYGTEQWNIKCSGI
jgi:hypothetical protein